jgi:hypothetical protein
MAILLLSLMVNTARQAAMTKNPETTHGEFSMPMCEMIGSPMANPKPRAIIIVVKNSELAAYNSCLFHKTRNRGSFGWSKELAADRYEKCQGKIYFERLGHSRQDNKSDTGGANQVG